MGVKLSDISEEIGVSTATISRVINKEPNVSPETRQLVEAALTRYNYKYRPRRKSIVSKNDNTVFIIAGQISNPITVEYIDGIRESLTPYGKRTFIALSDYQEDAEISYLQFAKDNCFAGVFLINAIECPRLIELLGTMTSPVILVNRYLRAMDCDLVKIDNYRCGYMATQYLVQHGHRRIAHLAGPVSSITCQDRTRGYEGAMRDAELQVPEDGVFYSNRDYYESGRKFGDAIGKMPAERRCTAVFSTTVLMAYGMIEGLEANGLHVPEDISLICSDDTEKIFHKDTTFTTVGHNPYTMGVAAAELYLERLKHPTGLPKRIIYAPELIERNSVRTLAEEKQ